MKRFLLGLITCVAVLLAGCELDGPLTEKPTRSADESLVGKWFSLEDGSPVDVYRLSDTELLVMFEGDPYVCTHSDAHGIAFLSCRNISSGNSYGKFAYMAYRIDGNELRFRAVDYKVLGLQSSPESAVEVRAAFEKAAKSPEGLGKYLLEEAVCKRKS